MGDRPWVILPVETKARELDAKIYLACVAAEAGFRVLLGEQTALLRRLALLPRGFYLDKSVARTRIRSFRRLKSLGFRILACCEEGLVYRHRDAYLHERVAPAALSQTDAFYAWGSVQAKDIRVATRNVAERIQETGNPRFDLLRPELRDLYRPEVEALQAKHGEFILINTNFARYNHYYGKDKILQILRERGALRNDNDLAFFNGWIEFLGEVFHTFEQMLPRLAQAFPRHKIIVRPHPSENHNSWRQIANGVPNVDVIYEGSVIPWLLAATVSIHNSCTTGLEAALLDRPVLSYRAARSETYDSFLPNRVSVNALSLEDLFEHVDDIVRGRYRSPLLENAEIRADVARYIASLEGPTAASRIVEATLRIASSKRHTGRGPILTAVRDQGEQMARTIGRKIASPWRHSGGYAQQKFPGLTPIEIEERVHCYQQLTGSFTNIRTKFGLGHLVTIDT